MPKTAKMDENNKNKIEKDELKKMAIQ